MNELDIVKLLKSTDGVAANSEGTIVYCYKQGDTFEVEFKGGKLLTLNKNVLEPKRLKKTTIATPFGRKPAPTPATSAPAVKSTKQKPKAAAKKLKLKVKRK